MNSVQKDSEIDPVKDSLIIFDTTLRDGEQSPGASMTQEEKQQIIMMQLSKILRESKRLPECQIRAMSFISTP